MKNNILSLQGITLLNKSEQKKIQGGYKKKGDLCNTRGPAKNKCGSGLTCDAGHIGIGICV